MQDSYSSELWDFEPSINYSNSNSLSGQQFQISERYGSRGYNIHFPKEVNKDTTVCITCNGAGGDGLVDVESVFRATGDKNVILISPTGQNDTDYRVTQKIANELTDKNSPLYKDFVNNGVHITESPTNKCITYGGHSNSSKCVIGTTIQHLMHEREKADGSGAQTRDMVLLNDPEHTQLLNREGKENLEKLDDSVIFVTTQQRYLDTEDGKLIGAVNGGATESYYQDLVDMGEAGALVMLVGYDKTMHTQAVEMTSELGWYDLKNAKLTDFVKFESKRGDNETLEVNLQYYYYDAEKSEWVTLSNVQQAQSILDFATGKVELYNSGFLVKEDGTYILGGQEVSSEELKRIISDYKQSKDKNMTLEEYISKNLGGSGGGTDTAEFNYKDTLAAVETLKSSLDSIGSHVSSLGNISGLNVSTNPHSSFLKDMKGYPSGVSTQGLQNAQDCLNKMCAQVENAYNIAVGVHTALLHAEDMAPTYYKSNTYAEKATKTNVETFAEDVTYVK